MNFLKKSCAVLLISSLSFTLLPHTNNNRLIYTVVMSDRSNYDPKYRQSFLLDNPQISSNQSTLRIGYGNVPSLPISQTSGSSHVSASQNYTQLVTFAQLISDYRNGRIFPADEYSKRALDALVALDDQRIAQEKRAQQEAALQEWKKAEEAHVQKYGISHESLIELYSIDDFYEVVRRILNMPGLICDQALALWEGYCKKRWFRGRKKDDGKHAIANEFHKRKMLEIKQQREAEACKKAAIKRVANEKKRKEQEQQQQQKLRATYEPAIKSWQASNGESSVASVYQTQREQALAQTLQDGGAKQVKTYEFDACTQGFLLQKEINPHEFQSLSTTIFGHQLFQEAADRYRKIAKVVFECGLQGEMVDSGVGFTQLSFESTQDQQFVLAAALSDFSDQLVECCLGILKGPIASVCNFIDIFRNPEPLIMGALNICSILGAGLEFANDSGTIPLSKVQFAYCQQRQMENLQEFEQMCRLVRQQFDSWLATSSVPDKCQAISTLVCDTVLLPALVGKTLGCFGALLAKGHELATFKNAATLAQDVGVGFQEAEQLLAATEAGMQTIPANAAEVETALTCLMESEQLFTEIQREVVLIIEEVTDAQKIAQKIEYVNKEISAKSVNAQDALDRKMRALESIMKKVVKIREFGDGRVRYYAKEGLAEFAGKTKGSCFVLEYNFDTGKVRTWQECYDHMGKVNRVHPKMIDGLILKSQHYPPTKSELIAWQGIKK